MRTAHSGRDVTVVPGGAAAVDGRGQHLSVVERMLRAVYFLTGLVAFTGDEDDIPRAGPLHGGIDGGRTVADLEDVTAFGVGDGPCPVEHRRADRGGVLAAGVVVGDDEQIGSASGDLAHERSLTAIAVSSGPDDDRDPAGGAAAQSVHHRRESRGFVGVVHDREKVLSSLDTFDVQNPDRPMNWSIEEGAMTRAFYITAIVVVTINLWMLARAAWDL